jgi:selenocysteine lyase/cysteine desulfurase
MNTPDAADIAAFRSEFPHIERGMIYLNHAATGPWSRPLLAMVERFARASSEGPIELYPEAMQILAELRGMAAALIGAEPECVAFAQNTSDGLNILASGLPWREGDEIVIPDREFPANVYPFLNLERRGVRIVWVPQRDGVVALEDIARAITPRTRLVAVSWVQFLSGFAVDLAALSALCRERGVLLSVDGIQGVGAMRLDLAATPVDFLSAGVQKWQMGPQGVALVYVSRPLQERLEQAYAGWLAVVHAWDFFHYEFIPHPDARRYEGGTYNTIGLYACHGSTSLLHRAGMEFVERRVRENASYAWRRAAEAGYALLTPEDPARRAGIVSFRHEAADGICAALQERGIVVSSRSGFLRISPHFYNTADDIDAAFAAIRELDARLRP